MKGVAEGKPNNHLLHRGQFYVWSTMLEEFHSEDCISSINGPVPTGGKDIPSVLLLDLGRSAAASDSLGSLRADKCSFDVPLFPP